METSMAQHRKLIGKQRLIDLVRTRMHGVGVGASCDGCGLKDVVRRQAVGDSSNWLPTINGGCSRDCERKLTDLLAHLTAEFDVIFPQQSKPTSL